MENFQDSRSANRRLKAKTLQIQSKTQVSYRIYKRLLKTVQAGNLCYLTEMIFDGRNACWGIVTSSERVAFISVCSCACVSIVFANQHVEPAPYRFRSAPSDSECAAVRKEAIVL